MKSSSFLLIVLVVIFAAILRVSTFYLPHNHGDQVLFLGLAMKLDKEGLEGYNLRGIDTISNNDMLAVVPAKENKKGTLLTGLENSNIFYYTQERISNMPPGFSFLLMLSHRIFNPKGLYMAVKNNLGPLAIIFRPRAYFNAQFYAVWPNFIFSISLVLLAFFLGSLLFNEMVGLWAAILMAVSPADILTSQRLWADDMVAFFITLSVFLYWLGKTRSRLAFFVFSGISAGIAALAKQSGIFIIFIIVITDILMRWRLDKKIAIGAFFNKELFCFVGCAIAVCGFWYSKIALIYGVPWYMPHQEGIEKVSLWSMLLAKKPRYGQLYYFVYLMPLFGFFYYEAFLTVVKKIFSPQRVLCLTWFIIFASILVFIRGKEERYMLPVYPAIAIFTGIVIERIRERYNTVRYLGDAIAAMLIVFASMWSIGIGLKAVFNNQAILLLF